MDNINLEEKCQKDDNETNQSIDMAKNPDCKKAVCEPSKNLQQESKTSQPLADKNSSNVLINLTKRTKNISDKLRSKRDQLKLSKVKQTKENELNVVKALNEMVCAKGKTSGPIELPNKPLRNRDLANPVHRCTKKQLVRIVEGFEELMFQLTKNDKTLNAKATKLARNINSLNDIYNYSSAVKDGPSTSGTRRHGSDFYQKERSNSKERQKTLKKKEKQETSLSEVLAKYINKCLSEYLKEQQQDKFETYKVSPSQIEDLESYATSLVQAGFGRIVESEIRVNHKNNRQSFVSMSSDRESSEKDGIIILPVARRYAFDGDIVRAFVFNSVSTSSNSDMAEGIDSQKNFEKKSTEDNSLSLADEELLDVSDSCSKAFVIRIVKQTELREIVGSISFMHTSTFNSKLYYKMRPHDMKVPMIYIPKDSCMAEIETISEEDVCGMLYVARVLETDVNGYCIGELVQPIGKVGNLQAEIKSILVHNGLKDIKPYEQKFQEMYEGPITPLSDENFKDREDLRKKCVFTIDPLTAKDLDDAVSVEKINNLEYEIGVHISDVSVYLGENSELDNLVKLRATSIYLVNEVLHMLPPSLCFRCSLLPGEDKFTFSVFWKWHTEKEELSTPRFTRSLINSCSQFAYEHAQKIIDNPTEELDRDDLPDLVNGWTPSDIQWRVLVLNEIAQKLKARRFENGAISINNPKLRFQFDPKTGEPLSYQIEDRHEANFLIEEFMLQANQSVAKFIHSRFPDTSILRYHPQPLTKSMKALRDRLQNMGLEFDISSSKSVSDSMKRLIHEADDPKAVDACLSALLTKPMTRARYFCSEGKTSDLDFWHYGLSIPIYTHFTSPIRRYPDIMVHRLLAAALNYCPPSQRTTEELHHLAKICNDQKLNAKNAGDESINLFFKRYLKAKQSIILKAVVTEIYKHMLTVLTIETGHTLQIDYSSQKVGVDTTNLPSSVYIIKKNSPMSPIKLQLFSTVDVNIFLTNDKICSSFAISEENSK